MAKSMYDLISKIGDIDNSGLGMIVEFMENNPKVDVNYENYKGDGNILFTKMKNKFKMELFLKYGADPNFQNRDEKTPLFYQDNADVIELLLKYGANPNHQTSHGETPLFFVNNVESAKILLNYGADINHKSKSGENALFSITDVDTAKFLISKGLDVNCQDKYGQSIVRSSVVAKDDKLMFLLLENNLNIPIQDFIYRINVFSSMTLKKILDNTDIDIYGEYSGSTLFAHLTSTINFLTLAESRKIDFGKLKTNGESIYEEFQYKFLLTDAYLSNLLDEKQLFSEIKTEGMKKPLIDIIIEMNANNSPILSSGIAKKYIEEELKPNKIINSKKTRL